MIVAVSVFLVFGHRSVGFGDGCRDGAEIHRGQPGPRHARGNLGDAQQGGEGFQNRVGLAQGAIEGSLELAGGSRARPRLFQAMAQPGERRAHIVGNVGGDLAHPVHQRLDTIEHSVQIAGQPVEIAGAAA